MKEKHEYQSWILQNFEADETNLEEIRCVISQSNSNLPENDLSDKILINKLGISLPIFNWREEDEVLMVDIIPGSKKKVMTFNEILRTVKGKNVVIAREYKESKYQYRIIAIEKCEEKINEIWFKKMTQITSEAQIEKGLEQINIASIDLTIREEGPNSLIDRMWKANWVAFEGLDMSLSIENKILVIKEILKALMIYDEKELTDDIGFNDRITEGVKK